MIELAVEQGYETITVRGLSRAAGVSTRSFYSHFANVEDCFVGTHESVMRQAVHSASVERDPDESWEAGIRARVRSLMENIAADPQAARLVLVETFAVRPGIQDRLGDALAPFEQLMTESLASAPTRVVAPPHLVTGIAAGVMCVARMTSLTDRAGELPGLANEVANWMLSLPSEQLLGARITRSRSLVPAPSSDAELQTPAGPSGNDRQADERARVFNAVAKLEVAGGFESLTGPRIRAEAGVSRRRFDASFADVNECFLGAVDAVAGSAATCAERQGKGAPNWSRGVHRQVGALCVEVARDERLARLAFVDLLAPGRVGLLHRERLIALGAARLRATAPTAERPSALAAEASIAAVWNIANVEVEAGRAKVLPRLAPLFTFLILTPAIGAATAIGAIRAEGLPF